MAQTLLYVASSLQESLRALCPYPVLGDINQLVFDPVVHSQKCKKIYPGKMPGLEMDALCGEGKVSPHRGPNQESETPHPPFLSEKGFLSCCTYHHPTHALPFAHLLRPPHPSSLSYHLGLSLLRAALTPHTPYGSCPPVPHWLPLFYCGIAFVWLPYSPHNRR